MNDLNQLITWVWILLIVFYSGIIAQIIYDVKHKMWYRLFLGDLLLVLVVTLWTTLTFAIVATYG